MASSFSNAINFEHVGEDFKKQNLGCSEVEFNDSNNAILGFLKDLNGLIINNRFPLEGSIESVPLFINSLSFPTQLPDSFVESVLDAGTNVAIEFRTAEQEDMSDATGWMERSAIQKVLHLEITQDQLHQSQVP